AGSGTAQAPVRPAVSDATTQSAATEPAASNAASPGTTPQVQESPNEQLKRSISARLEQIQAENNESTAELRDALKQRYQQSLVDLEATSTAAAKQREWERMISAAPESLKTVQARLVELEQSRTKVSEPQFESVDDANNQIQTLNAELATATGLRSQLTEQETSREKRRKELPQQLSDLRLRASQLTPPTAAPDAPPLMVEADNWSYETAQQAVNQQIAAYETEQRAYEAEATLLPLKIEVARAEEARLKEQLRKANERLNAIKSDRILQHELAMRAFLNNATEAESALIEKVLKRIDEWRQLVAQQADLEDSVEKRKLELALWQERRSKVEGRVDPSAGSQMSAFNSWVGLMLRDQRSELPNPTTLRGEIHRLQDEIRRTNALLFDLEDELREIDLTQAENDRAQQIDTQTGMNDAAGNEPNEEQLTLLSERKAVARDMKFDVSAYSDDLIEAAAVVQDTIDLVLEYQEFIDKHILWIRSCEPFQRSDLTVASQSLSWFASTPRWESVALALRQDLFRHPWWYLIFGVGMATLIFNQSRLRQRLANFSTMAAKNNCTDFLITLRALGLSCLLVLPTTTVLLFFYWRLSASASGRQGFTEEGALADCLANGLLLAATVFTPLELLRRFSRPNGLGTQHFGWHDESSQILARELKWLIYAMVPLVAGLGLVTSSSSDSRWESSIERLVYVALVLLLSVFFVRLLLPKRGVLSYFLRKHAGGWIDRTQLLWYPAVCIGPVLLAVASLYGYQYTARRIALHINSTLWMMVLLSTGYCLLARWLLLNRRTLMLAQARARLQEAAARQGDASTQPVATDTPVLSMVDLNEQTQRLLRSVAISLAVIGVYFVWSDVLPAIAMLDSVELWQVAGDTPDSQVSITLANIVLALPITVLIVVAGRNVPGLLEIALLQYLPLTHAAKYAITTLSRYAIFMVGTMVLASNIGLRWGNIQWLVAALGVGLGFGLQEIFANFVSGVILLFEQPIRVGDIITIDGVTGSVSRIRMRAITIVNWDRQELIVPNKDLITGKLLNWTLSDTTNRVTIEVGVAYGSDVVKACQIIQQLCDEHQRVLPDPKPLITFEGFGDNALTVVCRVFLASLEYRLATIHELHQQIYESLGQAGIEIAFPQRDLHVRTLPPELTRWLDGKTPSAIEPRR
ncbi:MAG: mechanosensitive ion channel, partial [Planctomycetales bacterium]|nr:mechanosensitive ion channel [Planctomycetales bacterium]